MDSTAMSNTLQIYKDVALFPMPVSAVLCNISKEPLRLNVYSTWKIPDLIRSDFTVFTREHLFVGESDGFGLLNAGVPVDTSTVLEQVFTKSGNKYAIFRKSKKSEDGVFLEVWNMSRKESTFDLTDSKEHGIIQYGQGLFGSFEWSADEKYLLYVANAHQEKNESYFKDCFCQKTDSTDEKPKGEEFLYKESWGESNTTAYHTVLCIFDIAAGSVEVLNLDDKFPTISIAQATWGPNDEYIVFVGYDESPFRLGVRGCSNRRSALFSYNIKSKAVERLTLDEDICVESPVFSPDHKTLVFLQNKIGGAHCKTKKLMKYAWESKEVEIAVDNIDKENHPAIYCDKLLKCWSSDNRYLFFNSEERSYMKIYYVDVQKNKVGILESPFKGCSTFLLDVKDFYIVAYASSPSQLPTLYLGCISISFGELNILWHPSENKLNNNLLDLTWEKETVEPTLKNETYSGLTNDIITISSTQKKNGTLIVLPHGGPHAASFVNYCVVSAAFAKLGFVVCKVNYRGSTGFGENSINSLLGNVGKQDVSDVVDSIEFLKNKKELGIKKVVGAGGSHGGFLIAHILGQYPDMLTAGVILNAVVDLSSMFAVTDIPDWCWAETGLPELYDPLKVLDPTDLEKMWQKSPIRYVKNVKAPTLICIGKCDLRVPPSQNLLFYRYLRAQNVPTKVYCYDDGHSLAKVGIASDVFVHMVSWFMKYLAA